jgi:hypothetical protein
MNHWFGDALHGALRVRAQVPAMPSDIGPGMSDRLAAATNRFVVVNPSRVGERGNGLMASLWRLYV